MKKMTTKAAIVAATVDELGRVKAVIADAEKREKELVALLKKKGEGRYEGDLFEANVFVQNREVVDWKAVAEFVGYSAQLKAAHTTKGEVLVAKVQARTGLAQAA
jgi:hypothetical protein